MPEYLRIAVREKISTFHQLPNELFWQAWQRFDQYRRSPHHGYNDVKLLQFFYYGVRRNFQVELDVTGFWDFCAEYTQGAYSLCDDMAMAEREAQELYLMEEANNRRDIRFNTVEQEHIYQPPFQEPVYCDIAYPYYDQEQAPPPQYQYPTPPPLKSVTTLEDLQAAFLEAEKTMKKMQEEFVAIKGYSESQHTPVKMVGNQMDEVVEVTESQQGTLPMCTIVEDEIEKMESEPVVIEAETAEKINLQPLPEYVEALEEELGAAESKEEMLEFIEEPPPVAIVQPILVLQEETPISDEDTLQSQEVQELEDAPHFELCVETENMPLAETCHDSSSAETENFLLADTEDISLTMESQTRHGFCVEDILESAAMPRKGPDKPEDHMVSQIDMVVHNDIRDNLAKIWSMFKKGNGFPWDTGISRELKLSDDHELDSRDYRVSNLLKPPLLFDHKSRGFLVKDGGKPAGIPRTGPDIQSFREFDQSQFLSFAGEGGSITYCDVIGSQTRPPEVLLNVPVLC